MIVWFAGFKQKKEEMLSSDSKPQFPKMTTDAIEHTVTLDHTSSHNQKRPKLEF